MVSEENVNPLRRQEFFFWLCAYAAVLVFLNTNSLFGAESLVAEAAREICVSREWAAVRINFQPFSGLHPLNVLSVALLYLAIGISEFSTRLLAALTALILFSGVRRLAVLLFDRRTALVAGWLTLGTYSVLYLGRSAGDCIPACAAVVWAAAWYLGAPRPMSFLRALFFYLLLFFAAALYGSWWLLPLGFLLPWWIGERSFRGALSRRGVAALFPVGAFGFLWWVRSGGAAVLAEWRSDPAALLEAFLAALKALGAAYLDRGVKFLYLTPLDIVRVLLPWPLLALAAGVTAVRRFRTAEPRERRLYLGIVAMLATAFVLPEYQWRLMMPLLPFIILVAAHGFTGESSDGVWSDYALVVTRSALLLMAALGAASPVTLPVLNPLLKFELPLVVIPSCAVTGIAVLAIMIWDSYPGVPLSKLLGGALITMGVVSLIVPALRDMREERPFLLEVRKSISDLPPEAVVVFGGAKHAAALLFYNRTKSAVTLIEPGDYAGFARLVESRRGRRIAVISRCRDGVGLELDFLRRCAKKHRLKLDVSKPDIMEKLPPFGDGDRRNALFLIRVPEDIPVKNENQTVKGK